MEDLEKTAGQKKPDRRVIKTKRAICNAFAELLSEKNINDITIKDIADRADVNRKTVYNYYSGIHEILDQIENDIVTTYEKLIKDFDLRKGIDSISGLFESLTEVLNRDMDFYGRLLKINTDSQLIVKIVNSLKEKLKEDFIERRIFPKEKIDLIVSYAVSGMVAAYQNWFNNGRRQPIREFSKDVSSLVLSGLKAFSLN